MTCISHVKSLSPTYAWSDPYYKMIASKIHSTKKHLILFPAQEMYNFWSRYGMTINYSCTIYFSSHCMYDVSLQCHMGDCCFATSSYATAVPHILQLSARPSSQKKMTDPLVRRYKRNSSTSWVFASMDIAWMLWTTFSRRHLWSHSTSHLSDTTMECPGKDWTSMVDWDSMVAWGRLIRWRRSPYKTVSTNMGMSGICLCCTLSSRTLLKWDNRRRKKMFPLKVPFLRVENANFFWHRKYLPGTHFAIYEGWKCWRLWHHKFPANWGHCI